MTGHQGRSLIIRISITEGKKHNELAVLSMMNKQKIITAMLKFPLFIRNKLTS